MEVVVLLIVALWFSPGAPDVLQSLRAPSLEACEAVKAEIIADATARGHKADVRCVVLKAGALA